ncbi:MAG: rhodanese-like domain-containing protein [Pseudomonadota bacterium]
MNARQRLPGTSVAIVAVLLVFFATAPRVLSETDNPSISAATFQAARKDEVVLDVRTGTEYRSGHLENAINININDRNFEQRIAALDPAKTYVVHCGANVPNGRADRALTKLRAAGFSNLVSLEGGYSSWVESGGTVWTSKD